MPIQDFVNREQYLATAWAAIEHKSDLRLLLVTGRSGTGKSYLIEECRQRCRSAQIATCKIDFMQSWSLGYLSIVYSMRQQLGTTGFERLELTLAEMHALGDPPAGRAQMPVTSAPVLLPVGADVTGVTEPVSLRSGGIDLAGTTTARDIVGRDVNYITQIFRNDGQFVAAEICERVSMALVQCLQTLAAQTPLVCFVDTWEKGVTGVQEWLSRYLISTLLDGVLDKTVIVVAGQTLPDVPRIAGQVQVMMLGSLPETALAEYWVQRRGLAQADFAAVMHLTRGHPAAVATLADLQSMPAFV